MKGFEILAEGYKGHGTDNPGSQFFFVEVTVGKFGNTYRAECVQSEGSNQGYLEEHDRKEVTARDTDWEQALQTMEERAEVAGIDAAYLVQAASKAREAMYDRETLL